MAAVVTPLNYRVASGLPVNAGRWPGGRVSGALSLADAALSGGFVATAGPAYSDSDWVARKSGPAVIAAHAFDYDAEVTQHLVGSTDPTDHPVPVRRVVDPAGFGCLEQVVIGATLAAPYTAGDLTATFDDLTMWPDPATDGPFAFMMAKAWPSSPDKNLFTCTARSGNTLTITRQTGLGSAFAPTAQNYSVGDYAGNENSREWRRTFAALPAVENGLLVDDPAASGAVPLRSKLTGNAYSVPRDASYFQYGWYGHASNQSTWQNWTGWLDGSTSLVTRGVVNGADAKYRLWDGGTIYIQFRIKFDPRFLDNHSQPDPAATQYWIRKTFALQSEVSSLNQLVVDQGPATIWDIPATPGMAFRVGVHKDSRVIGLSDWARPTAPAAGHPSYQGGSAWDVAPHYADLRSSGKPATGCPTPDGAAAWKMPSDEWFTVHLRIKPGRSEVAESEIKVEIARQDQPGYAGTYTTVLDVTDAKIVFSGSGDYSYPDGAFSYPTVQRMDALPGYQSFGLMGYLNLFQAAGWVPPRRSYYIRMAQVIFSQAPIPAPNVTPLQLTGSNWTPNVDGSGNVLLTDFPQLPAAWVYAATNKIDDLVPAGLYPSGSRYGTLVSGVDGLPSIVNAWSGAAKDWINGRLYVSGGGHNDSWGTENGVFCFDAATMRWTLPVARGAYTDARYWDIPTSAVITGEHPSGNNYPQGNGGPPAMHTYHSINWVPGTRFGGNTRGYFIQYAPGNVSGTLCIADLDTGAWKPAWWKNEGSSPKDFSYANSFVEWPYLWSMGLGPTSYFYAERFDLSATESTTYNAASQGQELAFAQGFNMAYGDRAFCKMEARGEVVNFGNHSGALVIHRYRLDDAVAASATANVASYEDTITLTGDTGDFTAAAFSENTAGSRGLLWEAGMAHDVDADCLWMVPNASGSATYKITGLNGTTWTVTKYASGATLQRSPVGADNGTFGRLMCHKIGGIRFLVRVSSTTSYTEVRRCPDN